MIMDLPDCLFSTGKNLSNGDPSKRPQEDVPLKFLLLTCCVVLERSI